MSSIFTRIINGEVPCYKIAENENCFAFLDINPLAEGHTLVVPKTEVDKLFDLDEALYIDLQRFSRNIARAIRATIPCARIGSAVIGLEVPHAHIHLVPINTMDDLNFMRERKIYSHDEFALTAKKIKHQL